MRLGTIVKTKYIGETLNKFISSSAPLLIVAVAARLYEFLLLEPALGFSNNLKINTIGLLYDVMFLARILTAAF